MADQPASEHLLRMMQKESAPMTKSSAAIEIKGSAFTLTVLRILTADFAVVEAQLAAKLAQAPKFFHNAPMVLDLLAIATLELDIQRLVSLLQGYKIIPVGICNAGEAQQQQAIALGLGVFQSDKVSRVVAKPTAVSELNPQAQQDSEKSAKPVEPPKAAKMIVQPVRSGQRIYAKGTDLIVLAAVSPGAEVLADGNIHIYAPLRGRALAGADGKNTQARIFCQCLDAELLSIAGIWSIDAVDERVQGKSVQVYLEDNRLEIVPFPLV